MPFILHYLLILIFYSLQDAQAENARQSFSAEWCLKLHLNTHCHLPCTSFVSTSIAKEGQHIAQHRVKPFHELDANQMWCFIAFFLFCDFSSHVQPPQPHPLQILLLKIVTGSVVMMCPNLSDPYLSSFLLHLFVIICSCFFLSLYVMLMITDSVFLTGDFFAYVNLDYCKCINQSEW